MHKLLAFAVIEDSIDQKGVDEMLIKYADDIYRAYAVPAEKTGNQNTTRNPTETRLNA